MALNFMMNPSYGGPLSIELMQGLADAPDQIWESLGARSIVDTIWNK